MQQLGWWIFDIGMLGKIEKSGGYMSQFGYWERSQCWLHVFSLGAVELKMEMLWNVEGFAWDSDKEIGGGEYNFETRLMLSSFVVEFLIHIEPPRCTVKGDFWFLRAPSFPFWNDGTARFNRQPSSIKVTSCVFLRQKKASTTTIIAWRLVGSDFFFCGWHLYSMVVGCGGLICYNFEAYTNWWTWIPFLFFPRYRLVHYQSINPMGVFWWGANATKGPFTYGKGVVKVSLPEALKVAVLQARSWRL